LNVLRIIDVRQTEIHSAEPFEITIVKLKKYKSPGIDQIPSELIKAGGEILTF
jgi:hypothetical protein